MNKLEIKVKQTLSYRRTTCVSRGPDGAAFMTGVFDGHAGPYNAQAVRKDFIFFKLVYFLLHTFSLFLFFLLHFRDLTICL